MPEPVLDAPRVMPGVGERIAAAMPQRVDVHGEREAGPLANPLDKTVDRHP